MRLTTAVLPAMVILATAVPFASAHFKLLEPASWITEADNGDPQKLGPCGGTTANPGTPSNIVTKVAGGTKLHIKLKETVYHPGHYRVALAVNNWSELPPDPEAATRDTEKGPRSVSAPIMAAFRAPLLADGIFRHDSKLSEPNLETDVDIPNINCPKCTLQITQFMAEHGVNKDGGFYYHHCADLQITADASKPVDARWPVAVTVKK